jgi:FAD/FMN-containing dehydrogenase
MTTGEYTTAAGAYGLATGFGDTGSVGIGGITLGGGVGFLSRKHGLTIDNLLAADIVTADGQLRRVSDQENTDLFWAIRGGGGNFGVVTRFQFRLHKLPSVYGGMLILPATPDVIAGFVAEAEAAPEELSTIVNVMTAPPMPFMPPEIHGKMVVFGLMVYAGDDENGQRVMAPFRALDKPIVDMLRPMRFHEMFPSEEGGFHPIAVSRNMFVDQIGHDQAQEIINCLQASDAPMRVAQLRILGGAISRVPADATAYAHRNARIMVNLAAFYNQPDERAEREAWINEFAESLDQGYSGAYVNFMTNEGARSAYPDGTWEQLAAIKSRYDPTNLFHHNHNILPAERSATK